MKHAFLAAYAATASVLKAAEACGINRCDHYRWLKDQEYAAAFERARGLAVVALEDEAVRRAKEGTKRPVFYKGVECGAIVEYSDSLLLALLRAWRPETYREQRAWAEAAQNGELPPALIIQAWTEPEVPAGEPDKAPALIE